MAMRDRYTTEERKRVLELLRDAVVSGKSLKDTTILMNGMNVRAPYQDKPWSIYLVSGYGLKHGLRRTAPYTKTGANIKASAKPSMTLTEGGVSDLEVLNTIAELAMSDIGTPKLRLCLVRALLKE